MQSHLSRRWRSSRSKGFPSFFQPLAHERGVDGVVVTRALGAGFVGRVDVDAVHPPGMGRVEGLGGFEIVAVVGLAGARG